MRIGMAVVVLAALLGVAALTACGEGARAPAPPGSTVAPAPTPQPFQPRFEYGACDVELPEGQEEGEAAVCGKLTVLENRDAPREGEIELAVVILRSAGLDPAPDPVIYLSGGPGGPALEFDMQQFTLDFAEPIQRSRDIVFFDQRGVGRSVPALDCPEIDDAFSEDRESPLYHSAIVDCRNRLRRDGVDLDAYNSIENAADIVDLAATLKYGSYNLYGVSYGTRLALTAMRDAPASVRSVVLDSPFPLQANLYGDGAATLEESLRELFDACHADAACSAFAPELQQTFFDVAARLDVEPVIIEAEAPDGEPFDVEIDGDTFVHLIFQSMYLTSFIPLLPAGIVLIGEGETDLLETLVAYSEYASAGGSLGMYLSVQCSEEVPFNTSATLRPAVDPTFARLSRSARSDVEEVRANCGAWSVDRAPRRENDAIRSGIPSLVLVGQFDPVTPPSYARETVRTLDHAYVFEFPGYGHAVLDNGCSMEIVAAFIDDPSADPDGSCIEGIPPVGFEAP